MTGRVCYDQKVGEKTAKLYAAKFQVEQVGLESAADAVEHLLSGRNRGKVAVRGGWTLGMAVARRRGAREAASRSRCVPSAANAPPRWPAQPMLPVSWSAML